MVEWWEHNGPPVYVSVAGYLGLIKKKSTSSPSKKSGDDLSGLAQFFGQDGMLL